MMKVEDYRRIAENLKHPNSYMPPLRRGDKSFQMVYVGKVVGKERPRSGRNGHFYTPTETRKFEKAVREQAEQIVRANKTPIYRCSCVMHLQIYDPIPSSWPQWKKRLAAYNYIQSWDGADMDNREKAIADALNGIVYEDDRQIVQVFKVRCYTSSMAEGFSLDITPTGLSNHDLYSIGQMLK